MEPDESDRPRQPVRISRPTLSTIAAHARREEPNECCGLLVGAGHAIDEAVPVRNVLAHPSRYQVDPAAQIALNRRLRGTSRAVIGVYHSHLRTAAVPSPRDLAEAFYPEFVWLIVSLVEDEPDYRVYRIEGGRADRVQMIVDG